jgi:hypothetical protein
MSGLGNISIALEHEAYELFMATRLTSCIATDCINNYVHRGGDRAECVLKRIDIGPKGRCMAYEHDPQEVKP